MPPLKLIMRLNALSCLVFGALFAAMPVHIAEFLGDGPNWIIRIVGIALVINGAHLAYASLREPPLRPLVLYFSAGDALWVVLTIILIATGFIISSAAGITSALLVAAMVGLFGLLQYLSVRETKS